MKATHPLICIVCRFRAEAGQTLLAQIEEFEAHMAEEHGVDL